MSKNRLGLLTQNPHAIRQNREKNLELAIGREIKALRTKKNITGAQLAQNTGLSIGMLSKIENGLTSPSLTTLQALAHALQVPLTSLFRGFEVNREAVHIKAGKGLEIEQQGTRAGQQYTLLGHITSNPSAVMVEPYTINLTEVTDVFEPFQHEGIEFIYMLEGCVVYRHGDQHFRLQAGDSLFFDSDSPHGPIELIELPARYISVISYVLPLV